MDDNRRLNQVPILKGIHSTRDHHSHRSVACHWELGEGDFISRKIDDVEILIAELTNTILWQLRQCRKERQCPGTKMNRRLQKLWHKCINCTSMHGKTCQYINSKVLSNGRHDRFLKQLFFSNAPPPLLHTITSHGDPLIIAHLLECDRIHFEIDRTSHGFICHNNMNKLGKKRVCGA